MGFFDNMKSKLKRRADLDLKLEKWEKQINQSDMKLFHEIMKESKKIGKLAKVESKINNILGKETKHELKDTETQEDLGGAGFFKRMFAGIRKQNPVKKYKKMKKSTKHKRKLAKEKVENVILLMEDLKEMAQHSQKLTNLSQELLKHEQSFRNLAEKERINIDYESREVGQG